MSPIDPCGGVAEANQGPNKTRLAEHDLNLVTRFLEQRIESRKQRPERVGGQAVAEPALAEVGDPPERSFALATEEQRWVRLLGRTLGCSGPRVFS